ncbi:SoxR reducing system RseC family protein [Rosettibacter firmus]|uniref:SoxR reducing system RseC family protein n=1 Tax=Rosettibacter firmus TaxID=3111522 RepID=UPI00336BE163
MLNEELIEEGIVISSSNGYAEVLLNKNDNCKECAANILCKPADNNSLTLKVIDPFNTKPGDYIKIKLRGTTILKYSFLLYGISLILFLLGIIAVDFFFYDYKYVEVISFFAGIILVFLYSIILRKIRAITIIPKIIYVKRQSK